MIPHARASNATCHPCMSFLNCSKMLYKYICHKQDATWNVRGWTHDLLVLLSNLTSWVTSIYILLYCIRNYYPIYDKTLLTIIATFEEWRPDLVGAQHQIQVVTDHKNLIYFSTTWTLNRRQARWPTFLADYDFEIIFRPSSQHLTTDVLCRWFEFELTPDDESYVQ